MEGGGFHGRTIYSGSDNRASAPKRRCREKNHSIASGRALPSMTEFLYICDYFNITPMEFFNDTEHTSAQQQRAIQYIRLLNDYDTKLIADMLERLYRPE